MTEIKRSLSELGGIKNRSSEQEEYQKEWKVNQFQFREMIAKKNRKWLKKQSKDSQFVYYKEFPDVYEFIKKLFQDKNKRKWLIHIITNFLPLNKSEQVPKLPSNRKNCPITHYQLTDTKSILTGDRDKHIAYTGESTNIVLSGIALQELERFVINCTYEFDNPEGHIVNFALDSLRQKSKK
jgi:hypothetical protein